jgi:hypothetical protein
MPTKTSRFAFAATAAAVLSIFSAQADAPVYVRVALVMGNAAYVSAPKLANPGNDAKAMGDTLRAQGFNVIEVVNGSKVQMQSGIAKIRDTLRGQAGIGMLYYAGHGLQLNEHNFMVPVEAKLNKADDIPKEAVDVSEAIAAFKSAGNRMNIIVLDACRDNPFGKSSQLKGLAPIDAPVGTFLAYATAPGNVAEDGDEKSSNGLYTSFLLQEMKKPNARIEDVFKRVRYQVRQKSEGRQVPWESTSLEEDFVFSDGLIVPPSKFTPETAKTAYETELAEWKTIGSSRNVSDFYAFLQKHPNSALTLAAQGKIDDLDKTNLIVQGGGADGKNAPLSIQPYRAGQNWTKRMVAVSGNTTQNSESKSKVTDCDSTGCDVELTMPTPKDGITFWMKQRYSPSGGYLSVKSGMSNRVSNEQPTVIDPPLYLVPPGLLQIGQRWNSTTVISQGVNTTESRVVARERVTTPAGTFDSFRVEAKTQTKITLMNNGQANESFSERESVYWVSPAIPTEIKHTFTIRMGGVITHKETSEIVEYLAR